VPFILRLLERSESLLGNCDQSITSLLLPTSSIHTPLTCSCWCGCHNPDFWSPAFHTSPFLIFLCTTPFSRDISLQSIHTFTAVCESMNDILPSLQSLFLHLIRHIRRPIVSRHPARSIVSTPRHSSPIVASIHNASVL
jgi:hypothetical protein